ncbi:MAG: serine/threonine protein kinase [Planctomycetes bacterium]|nr:serine/threonine protein kinase [Planctomycetota bacterium]
MNIAQYKKAIAIFQGVVELSSDDRRAAIERHCGSDLELRTHVESLLSHDHPDWELLDRPFLAPSLLRDFGQHSTPPDLRMPESIGRYRLIETIGQGAMGVVYRAEQANPQREVAIKVMVTGQISEEAVKRFEREGRALARLHHPGIAQIYDAGTDHAAPVARPYLVMELIRGTPLGVLMADDAMSIKDRISVFLKLCSAMEYAHGQGVIHRDLKPENVIVENGDDGMQPKVLDFGIARLFEGNPRPLTLATEPGQLLGTLAYMSPEQLHGESGVSIDVYALGVLLYQLLTRSLPFKTSGRTLPQILADIEHTSPPRPSHHNPNLAGDIDTIILKALEKDTVRRYSSAGQLAEDLKCFLEHRPIHAREPSLLYVAGKFARRRRGVFIAGCIAVLAVIVGGLMGWYGFRRAKDSLNQLADMSGFFAADLARNLDSISGTFEVRKNLLARVQQQLDMLLQQSPDDIRLWETYANVLQYLGNIDRDEGRNEDALRRRHEALQWRKRILERNPSDIGARAKLSIDQILIGDLHRHEPGLATSLRWYESALEIQKEVVDARPDRIDWLDDLGWSYERLAFLAIQTLRLDEAERLIQLRLGVCATLESAEPDAPRTMSAWRSGYWMQGDLAVARGDAISAYGNYQKSFDYAEALYKLDPNSRSASEYYAGATLKLACPPAGLEPSRPLPDYLRIAENIAEHVERIEPSSEIPGRLRREVEFKRYLVAKRLNDPKMCHQAVEAQLRLVRASYRMSPTQDGATAYEAALTYGTELAETENDRSAILAFDDERFQLYESRARNPGASPRDKARYACLLARRDSSDEIRDEARRWAREAFEEIGDRDPWVIYSAATALASLGDYTDSRHWFESALTMTSERSELANLIRRSLDSFPAATANEGVEP